MPASTSAASSSSTSLCMLQGERKKVAVVTGASKGLGLAIGMELLSRGYAVCMGIRGDDPSVLEGRLRLDGYGASDYSVVPNMDVKRVKAISAAAVSIGERFPEGIDVLVNNAAVSPDGFDYDVAGEALDTNFYGSLNMVRRIVPARWSDAVSGKWLPSKVHAGMRAGGVICNIVCGQGEETTRQALRERFSACNSESELVMMLTEYHGLAAYGGDAHLSAGWPSNAYLVSKVALVSLLPPTRPSSPVQSSPVQSSRNFKQNNKFVIDNNKFCLNLSPDCAQNPKLGKVDGDPLQDDEGVRRGQEV
jgi:NAD(P)-dependent dehydrogenase (short-subunit alcohol dehydrogenase family)